MLSSLTATAFSTQKVPRITRSNRRRTLARTTPARPGGRIVGSASGEPRRGRRWIFAAPFIHAANRSVGGCDADTEQACDRDAVFRPRLRGIAGKCRSATRRRRTLYVAGLLVVPAGRRSARRTRAARRRGPSG